MPSRKPIVAGQFYPGRRDACLDEIREMLAGMPVMEHLPETIVAGIVPHAGWAFSGRLAAMVFSAIKQRNQRVDTFAIFGAAHSYFGLSPAVYDKGSWTTPLGEIAIDEELAAAVIGTGTAVSDTTAHRYEHSIEVQVPFIQHLFKDAAILPILTPPAVDSINLGQAIAKIIKADGKKIVCIGSTDLTHYGPHYNFEPMGTGAQALQWASQVNDKKFIDLALKLEPGKILTSASENGNACGPGAAAAAVAAAKNLGKTQGVLLDHISSYEVMLEKYGNSSQDSVGYAAIIF